MTWRGTWRLPRRRRRPIAPEVHAALAAGSAWPLPRRGLGRSAVLWLNRMAREHWPAYREQQQARTARWELTGLLWMYWPHGVPDGVPGTEVDAVEGADER